MPYTTNIEHTRRGEPVNSSVDSRAARTLAENVAYLKNLIENSGIGSNLTITEQTLESETVVGTPVFYSQSNQRFERGLASAEVNSVSGTLVAKDTANIVGIVIAKSNETLGDILLLGYKELDISEATSNGEVTHGRYYLSASTAGKLVHETSKPYPSVPVLFTDGTYVFVTPYVKDFVSEHVHYRFELECRPSGYHEPPQVNEKHTIEDPDASVVGWLPSDHPTFEGRAPFGAVFGYNIAADPDLSEVWPPIPVEAAGLIFDREGNGGVEVPLGGEGLAIIDENGIWWTSSCYDDVPWPTDYNTTALPSVSSQSSNYSLNECPRVKKMRLYVCFSRAAYLTDQNVVSSITTSSDGPLQILNNRGQSANKGNLQLLFSWASVDRHYPLIEDKLDGTLEKHVLNVRYVAFPSGSNSALYGKILVPSNSLPNTPKIKLRLQLLGKVNGVLPSLTVTYKTAALTLNSVLSIPATESTVTVATNQSILADKYVTVESEGFNVSAGDQVLIKIARSNTDSYGGEVGLLSVDGILYGD